MKKLIIIPFLLVLFLQIACEEPDCISSVTNFANVTFYKFEENEPDTIEVNSIRAVGSDSILVDQKNNIRKVTLPLDPFNTSSTFIFDTEYGTDTLVLTYKVGSRMISEDCGIEILYSDLDYVISEFDSIRILNKILVEEINEDIRVYN